MRRFLPMSATMERYVRERQMETATALYAAIATGFVASSDYLAVWIAVAIPVLGLVGSTTNKAAVRFGALLGISVVLGLIVLSQYYAIANHGFMLVWCGFALTLAAACDAPRDVQILRRNAAMLLGILMAVALIQKVASAYYMQGELLGGLLIDGEIFANLLNLVVPDWHDTVTGYQSAGKALMAHPEASGAAIAVPALVSWLALRMTWSSLVAQAVLEGLILFRVRAGMILHVAVIGFVLMVYSTRNENVFLSVNCLLGYAMTDEATRAARPWYVVLVLYLLTASLLGLRPWVIS